MSNKNFKLILMALVAMSFFKTPFSFAQQFNSPKSMSPGTSTTMPDYKIKTPNTKKQLLEGKPVKAVNGDESEEISEKESPAKSSSSSAAPRRLQQHGIGFGLGETFLMGNYSKYGSDKITVDLLYSYAASYSFDLLLNAHMSEHKDNKERMKVMGLTSSIKGRFVEYDNFSPYFLGGLGFYVPQAKRLVGDEYKWSDRKITFGLNMGSGIDLRLNDNYVIGVMGQLHWPFTVQQDKGSDIKGYYFKLLITGMYLF